MSRRTIALLAALLIPATACKRDKKKVEYIEEGSSQLSTAINVADPRSSIQMLRGFHDLESNAWRWTASKFAVALRPPKDAKTGGRLYLDFVMAEAVSSKVGMPSVSVTIDGKALPPQQITKNGPQKLEWDLPPDSLLGEVLNVEFSVDKFLAAGAVELRELALIVNSMGIQSVKAAPTGAK